MNCTVEHQNLTVPVQENGFDCGLFVINYARSWVNVQSISNNDARNYSFPVGDDMYKFSRLNFARDILTLRINVDIV